MTKQPDAVKFFHDSMQSYLTAEGLFSKPDEQGWADLVECAGDMRFTVASSDLVTAGGSELFQFCTEVFQPREELKRQLTGEMRAWARHQSTVLAAEAILGGLAPNVAATLQSDVAIRTLLDQAISACEHEPDPFAELIRLYAKLAPVVWPRIKASRPTATFIECTPAAPPSLS